MKMIINIDEEMYKDANILIVKDLPELKKIIANGTLLPEGCDVERIIPKKVNVQKWIYTKCPNPNCDYELSTHHGDGYYSIEHKPDFCPNCGQALLWGGENE